MSISALDKCFYLIPAIGISIAAHEELHVVESIEALAPAACTRSRCSLTVHLGTTSVAARALLRNFLIEKNEIKKYKALGVLVTGTVFVVACAVASAVIPLLICEILALVYFVYTNYNLGVNRKHIRMLDPAYEAIHPIRAHSAIIIR